jgi:hypothetical protein
MSKAVISKRTVMEPADAIRFGDIRIRRTITYGSRRELLGAYTTSQGFATINGSITVDPADESIDLFAVVYAVGHPQSILHTLNGCERWKCLDRADDPVDHTYFRNGGPFYLDTDSYDTIFYQLSCESCGRRAPSRQRRDAVIRDYINHDCRGVVNVPGSRARW